MPPAAGRRRRERSRCGSRALRPTRQGHHSSPPGRLRAPPHACPLVHGGVGLLRRTSPVRCHLFRPRACLAARLAKLQPRRVLSAGPAAVAHVVGRARVVLVPVAAFVTSVRTYNLRATHGYRHRFGGAGCDDSCHCSFLVWRRGRWRSVSGWGRQGRREHPGPMRPCHRPDLAGCLCGLGRPLSALRSLSGVSADDTRCGCAGTLAGRSTRRCGPASAGLMAPDQAAPSRLTAPRPPRPSPRTPRSRNIGVQRKERRRKPAPIVPQDPKLPQERRPGRDVGYPGGVRGSRCRIR